MPEQRVIERACEDECAGKSPSAQAGEFVREEFHHIREGKHGARSPHQAIAVGLSKARRAGVKLPPPARGQSTKVRRQAERDYEKGRHNGNWKVSGRRSQASLGALRREGRMATGRKTSWQSAAAAHKAVRTNEPARGHAMALTAASLF
jgi:hypothetical protein